MIDAHFDNGTVRLFQADARAIPLPDESVDCVVTSPPYWGLRDYGLESTVWGGDPVCEHEWGCTGKAHHPGQVQDGKAVTNENAIGQNAGSGQHCTRCAAWLGTLGLEPTPELYCEHLVEIFREVRRVLKPTGTVWCNMGDSYAANWNSMRSEGGGGFKDVSRERNKYPPTGLKSKDLVGIPWRVAFALQADGWWLRSDIIWSKPNPMPESVTDRPTKAHEYLFLLTKAATYFYDQEAVREPSTERPSGNNRRKMNEDGRLNTHLGFSVPYQPDGTGRNRRSVWEIATQPYPEAHFATFPEALVEPCILAGTSEYGNCPKCGSPWERQVEKGFTGHDGDTDSGYKTGTTANRLAKLRQASRERGGEYVNEARTTGWNAACACKGTPGLVPSVVLDPFAGSGTVGVVAQKLGRHAVLVEASEEYCELAVKRLSGVPLPLMAQVEAALV